MPNDAIIQINNLTAKYSDDVILDNITFNVYQNEIFVVLGGSGCGKSTLLRHTIGLEMPFAGNVTIDGADLINCSET